MADMSTPAVAYVLLYRDERGWRTTVSELPEAKACGMLPNTPADAPFDAAAAEFEVSLRRDYGLSHSLTWREIRPNWWGADVQRSVPDSETQAV